MARLARTIVAGYPHHVTQRGNRRLPTFFGDEGLSVLSPELQHLASWAAMCPGNHESAGKQRSGRTNHGNRWLRASLTQAAWAASHSKNTYLSSQYRRLAGRRGKKRAIVAVGHSLLVMIYHMLRNALDYHELGHDYLDKLQPRRLTTYLVKRLESPGHKVTLAPAEQAP